MKAASYIADGYTQQAYLEPIERLHDGLRFSFRPVTVEESSEFLASLAGNTPKRQEQLTARLLVKKVAGWNLLYPSGHANEGKPVERTEANFLKLNRRLSSRLTNVVLGIEPWDEDPEAAAKEEEERKDDSFPSPANG